MSINVCEPSSCVEGCQFKASCESAISQEVDCPPIDNFNGSYYVQPLAGTSFSYVVPGSGVIFSCPSSKTTCYRPASNGYFSVPCIYQIRCDDECEAKQKECELRGDGWQWVPSDDPNECGECVKDTCDTTKTCIEYASMEHCIDVPASSSITCTQDGCSGLPYSMWWTDWKEECSDECGNKETNTIASDTLYSYDSTCDDSLKCSNEKYCVDGMAGGTYAVYKKCVLSSSCIGNNCPPAKAIPKIISSGKGYCNDIGMNSSGGGMAPPSSEPGGGGDPGGEPDPIDPDKNKISDQCLVYGVGCPPRDTTNYEDPQNRNGNNCTCEPFDGMATSSVITCPDGSKTIVYYPCDVWRSLGRSSSSHSTPSSSSHGVSSEGGVPGSSDDFGQYPQYPVDDRNFRSNTQSSLSGIGGVLSTISGTLKNILSYLSLDDTSLGDMGDLKLPQDSSQTDVTSKVDSLFHIIDNAQSPIDTSAKAKTGTCPCITANFSNAKKIPFFRGNQEINLVIDTANIKGWNVCQIFRALVIAFGGLVSFMISAKFFITKNAS